MEEANWPQTFDMDHFKALTSFKARMDYCQAHLPRIGGGTGRMVYQIDDQTVIKLAKNAKGVAQNKVEDNDYIQRAYDHVVAKVLDRHPEHLWIESQLAKKVTKNRFKQLTGGISIEDVDIWMRNYALARKGERYRHPQDEETSQRIWNHEFLFDVASMANDIGMEYGDFGSISSYGEINGELVLVDYGLDSHTYSTHYNKEPKKSYNYGYGHRVYEHVVEAIADRILSKENNTMHKEHEGSHYIVKLKNIIERAHELSEELKKHEDLPAWVQDKITISEHNMDAICEYLCSDELSEEEHDEACSILEKHGQKHGIYEVECGETLEEAEYQGRNVELGKIMRGDVKKFKVYVKNPEGRVVKVNFGQKGMKIKKDNPERRKSFRARHNCDNPGPKHKARYWACKTW